MARAAQKAGETKTEINELIALVKTYALQETVGPLKRIARTLALGSAAAMVFGVAAVLTLVGVLRVLQAETGGTFAGQWTWVPYLLTIVAGLVLLGVFTALTLRKRSETP